MKRAFRNWEIRGCYPTCPQNKETENKKREVKKHEYLNGKPNINTKKKKLGDNQRDNG